ncbi:MAG: hypothetical protein K6E54_05775 [Bacteroidaceae bacterium]|nr:hypothetical protein [Bacteroidaceae bacterium]
MNRLLTIFTVAVFQTTTLSLSAQTQDDELVGVLTYMKRAMMFNQSLPQEKVYLHFDNTGYFKGETIWFKAYVVRADKNLPTDMSKVMYVELVNPTGDVVETRKLPIKDGVAHGDIKLDSIYGSGFYEVRAYTRYMTNWGNGGIFSRVFPIFEEPKTEGNYSNMVIKSNGYRKRLPNIRSNDESTSSVVDDRKLCVRFFPEGGHMVNGIPSRIAFRVTDKAGAYQNLSGSILDENKETISAANTYHEGRGVFEIIPDGKAKYLRLVDEKGKQHDFLIPDAEDEGIAMNMNTLKDDVINVLLQSSKKLQGRLLGYTLMHNGNVIHADTLMCNPVMEIYFDRYSLPAGVSQLTIFTSDGHIQAERQFFICPPASSNDTIRISSPMAYPKPCGKVVLNIKAQPNSNLSLSAIDAATMVNGKEGNAMTWMLLSSDIKGYIEDPDYYFEADDREHRMSADLLMMVQGWRRYDWALMASAITSNEGYSLFNEESAKFTQPIEDKLYLFGTLKQKKKKNPVDNVWLETYLYNKSGQSLKGTAKTDSLGNYAFSLPNVDGEWKLFINTGKEDEEGYWKDVNYYVGIDRHFSPKRRLLMPNETKPTNLLAANLFNDEKSKVAAKKDNYYVPIQKREHVLPTVTVKVRRRIFDNARASWESQNNAQYYASMFYNADADADRFEDLGMELPTVYSWLHQRNPFFSNDDKDYAFNDSEAAVDVDAAMAESRTATLGDLAGDMENENDVIQASEMSSTSDKGLNGENLDADVFESTDKQHRIYTNGMGYKNRPIVWILNNTYAQITHLGTVAKFSSFEVLARCVEDMPIFIDEIKSAYISEDPGAFRSYLICPDLMGKNPVTIFLFTHFKFPAKGKGIRKSHFQGYNIPSTFEMEDYSLLPAMEDFRRTIFWEPDVKTDASGNAQVEFWNNSSCHEMYISAEGMTPDGKMMIHE